MNRKNLFLLCLFLGANFWLNGQTTPRPISIAYFGQFAIEPGLKISTEFGLNKWTTDKLKAKNKQLFISPQLGFFVRPDNNSNLLLNADIGIKKQKEGKSGFSAFSLGLGYLHQFQISAIEVQLGDGNQSTSRESIAYFLPTINYAFGNKLGANIGWYSKIGVGQRLGGGISSSLSILFEIGLQFRL